MKTAALGLQAAGITPLAVVPDATPPAAPPVEMLAPLVVPDEFLKYDPAAELLYAVGEWV